MENTFIPPYIWIKFLKHNNMKRYGKQTVSLKGHTEHKAGDTTFKVRMKESERAVYHKGRGANGASKTRARVQPKVERAEIHQNRTATTYERNQRVEARKAKRKAARIAKAAARK